MESPSSGSDLEVKEPEAAVAPGCADLLARSRGRRIAAVSRAREVRLHHLFEARAAAAPEATALAGPGLRMSYGELNGRANRLARLLLDRGVRTGEPVGIRIERRSELVLSLLAVLKAGGACLPLDPEYPAERLRLILDDARPRLVLACGRPQGMPAEVVDLDALDLEAGDASDLGPLALPADLAFVLYTSGSTGRPKGVMMTHGGRGRRQLWTQHRYRARPADRHLLKSPIGFGTLIREVFWPLTTVGSAVLAPPGGHRDPAGLARLMREQGVTIASFVPSLLRELLEDPGLPGCAALRHVFCTGEALPVELQTRFAERLPWARLHLFYGGAEIPTATYWDFRIGDPAPIVTAGVPAGTDAWVLDRDLEPVPAGVSGEVFLGGEDLARGYLGRPDLTAERFVPDPFSRMPGGRLFRTGDAARWCEDGRLEYLGRLDQEVKIRGGRVHLGEVADLLRRHPRVREAVVLAASGLTAYYIPDGEPPSAGELRRHLAALAPSYMVPATYVPLPRFPLNEHGKVDRRALAELALPETAAQPGEGPCGAIEEVVAAIWREVGVPAAGREDDFFDLGGSSLSAMRVRAAVRDRLGVDLRGERLFARPTLRGLAAEIERAGPCVREPEPAPPAAGVAPLSAAQKRLWYIHLLNPGSPVYNVASAYEVRGPFDGRAMRLALETLVGRHEVLRSAVLARDGEPVQVCAPAAAVPLPEVDLGALPGTHVDAEALRLAAELARRPLDPEQVPQLSACLLLLEPERRMLVLVLPHRVCDGWSRGVLERELSEACTAFGEGRDPALPRLPLQCSDLARGEERWRAGAEAEQALQSWKERLRDLPPPLDLPGDSCVADWESAGESVLHLEAAATAGLRRLARLEGATLFTVLYAAFALLLSRLSGRTDVVIGSPVSRRQAPEDDLLIGCLVNTLPLRLDLAAAPAFPDLVQRARDVVSHALALAEVPFDALVEALNPERRPRRNPFFEVTLSYVDFRREPLRLGRAEARRFDLPATGAKFDLACYAADEGDGLRLRLVHRSALFSRARAEGILDQYAFLLRQVAREPGLATGDLSLMTPSSRPLLPDLAARIDEPEQETVCAQFLRLAALQPDAPALRADGEVRTYRELALDAEALAQRLRALGLRRGDRVAVVGRRCPGLVTAVLAVLSSGGVLLLVDESLPGPRQRSMLDQAGARWIVRAGCEELRIDEEAASGTPGYGEDAACIFFTSGSTGVPKGIVLPHKGISHFLAWEREALGAGPSDRVPLLTALGFDAVLRDLFLPLTCGGTLSIPPDELAPGRAVPWFESEGITIVHTVPAVAQTWLASLARPARLRSLRCLLLSGEPLTGSLVRRWRAAFPESGGIVNLYGPTETVMCKCWYEVPREPLPGALPAGRPLPQTQALVMASGGRLCGVGELGEIVLRTPFRSLGYLDRPELQRERFVANPMRDDPADLLYRTGDLGRFRPDGSLEIRGRVDRQVKVRGARIELEEVETALAALPGVAAAAVAAPEDPLGERRLVAYVVPSPGQSPDPSALAAGLRERLPAYMVPSAFVPLDRLPRTATGKVDRAALPAPGPGRPDLSASYLAPRSPLELQIAQIWEELLGVRPVGIRDSFFDLGGHSLLAIRMLSRIEQGLGSALRPADLFPEPTVESLARLLAGASAARPWSPLVPIRPTGSRPPLFCVHPAGGAVICYVDLARCLGPDQPVYGIQGPDPRGGREPFESVEEMASCYVAALCALQPEGPYLLAGFSFGGLIAFEMGQQLRRAGHEVALLALLDTGSPRVSGLAAGEARLHHELGRLLERHDLGEEAAGGEDERRLWGDLLDLARRYANRVQGEPGGRRLPGRLGAVSQLFRGLRLLPTEEEVGYPEIRRYLRFLRANLRAGRRYRAVPGPHRIVLFRTEERLAGPPEGATDEPWSALAGGGLEVREVPGLHLGLLTPPAVEVLARQLDECIARAAARGAEARS